MEALDNTESYQNHTRTVDEHSTESVGGNNHPDQTYRYI